MGYFISLTLHLVLGAVAYAALSLSSFDTPTKIFFGSIVLLWAVHHDFNSFSLEDKHEHGLKVILCCLRALEDQINNEPDCKKIIKALAEHNQSMKWDYIGSGSGISTFIVLGVKYLVWVVGGIAIAKYIVPMLSTPSGF